MYHKSKKLEAGHLKKTAIEILQGEKYDKVKASECIDLIKSGTAMVSVRPNKNQSALEDKIRASLKIKAA